MGVRLEKVILEVEDRASRPMAKFAATTRSASDALHDLDGTSTDAADSTDDLGKSTTQATAASNKQTAAISKQTAAVSKLSAASSTANKGTLDALGSLRVAEIKLQEVRNKAKATASQVAAAEEAVAKARRQVEVQTARATKATEGQATAFRKADSSINQLSGRLKILAGVAVTIGPALAPIGALAVPAVTGLASALGFTAIAAGTVVAGFQGVGTALKAVNKAQLEPTAENLEAAREAMLQLSPAARGMVRDLDGLGPAFEALSDAAAEGLAPGIGVMADEMLELLPKLSGIFEETARAAGDFAGDAAGSLNSERWAGFIKFIEREAPAAMTSLGRSAGDLAHGLAGLWMAFDPLNDDVLGVIGRAADGFDKWANNLSQTQGFQDFVDYVRQSGPQVADAFKSIGNAVLQIAEASAPLGGPVLAAISAIADGVAAIADSPLGTPFLAAIAAVTTLNAALKLTAALAAAPVVTALTGGAAVAGTTAATAGTAAAGGAAAAAAAQRRAALSRVAVPAAVGVGGALVADNLQTQFGGISTTIDDLAAQMQSGRLPAEFDNLAESISRMADPNLAQGVQDNLYESLPFLGSDSRVDEAKAQFDALDGALTQIAQQQGPKAAVAEFENLTRTAGLSADKTEYLKSQLTDYTAATKGISEVTAPDLSSVVAAAKAMARASSATSQFRDSLEGLSVALEGRSTMRDYEASIDAARASLKQYGKTLNITTEGGRANAAALDAMAASAVASADKMKGFKQTKYLAAAREDFIAMAIAMGKTRAQAERLADRLGLLDRTKVNPRIEVETGDFDRKTRRALEALLNLDRKKANPNADLNTTQFTNKQRRAINDVGDLDRKKAVPTADLNDGPFSNVIRTVTSAINKVDRANPKPTVSAIDRASSTISNIIGLLSNVRDKSVTVTTYYNSRGTYKDPGERYVGGYTGHGHWLEPAGTVHRGEVVIPQHLVQRDRAALANRYGHLPGMDQLYTGGMAVDYRNTPASQAPTRPQQVAVSFADAAVNVRMPDGSVQQARLMARVADERIDAARRHDLEAAG